MNNQVVVVGVDEEELYGLPEVAVGSCVFRNGVGLVQLKTNQQVQLLVKRMESRPGADAFPLSKFYQIIGSERRVYSPLHRFCALDFVDFQFSGVEQLLILNNDCFTSVEQHGKDFEEICSFPSKSMCSVSDDGMFVCFYNGNELELRAGKELEMFNSVILDAEITDVMFSPDSRYLAIRTGRGVEVWRVFSGDCMIKDMRGEVVFEGNTAYFLGENKVLSLADGTEIKSSHGEIKAMKQYGNQTIMLLGGKVQKIQYSTDGHTKSKTQANIEQINFYFAESRCFALISKKIQKEKVYFLESYSKDEITLTQLSGCVDQVEVSTDFFVVVDSTKCVSFYLKDRFGFSKIKEIKKEDDVLVALRDNICCLYDSGTDNIEFYDGGELRSVYSHQSCNSMQWSCSGLYLCCASTGDNASGLVQMFDRNGRLLWKKVFNRLRTCLWRPFAALSEDEKSKALEGFDAASVQMAEEKDDTKNIDELLSRWKSYLLSKKQNYASK